MKPSRFDIICQAQKVPELRFESQTLTSFAGLVLIQELLMAVGLKRRLKGCFRKVEERKIFPRAVVFLQMILHLILGYRELQDSRYYRDDPLVKRVLGLKRLPEVATLSRMLKDADPLSVAHLRRLLREKWNRRFRFVFVRTRTKQQEKGPVQLDLFIPHVFGYEFKVIVTNKQLQPENVVTFHEGRGSQEGVFGDLKTACHIGYVPVRTLMGNQMYMLAGLMAHNLTREMQMRTTPRLRNTTAKRSALWAFEKLDTLRKELIRRAGRLTRPQGRLTLTISANRGIRSSILNTLAALKNAA